MENGEFHVRGDARKYAPVYVEPSDGTNYTLQHSNRTDSVCREQGNENYNINIDNCSIYLSGMFHTIRSRTLATGLEPSRLGLAVRIVFQNSGNGLSYSNSPTIFLFPLAGVYWQLLNLHYML